MGTMMYDKWKMEDLYSKYKGFQTPTAKILVGDSGIDLIGRLNAQIDSLSISLSMDTTNSVSFNIVNAYDSKSHSFNSSVMDQLVLGNLLKVKLGYSSSMEQIFTGFIYAVKVDFSDMATLSVTALDVRRVMEDSVKKAVSWKYTTYSEIFSQVMQPYKKLYSKLIVDQTTSNAVPAITQNESDLAFCKRLATEGNREFFVFDDVVYFRRKSKKAAVTTLTWGKDLISFSKESIYVNQKVTILGMKKDGKEQVSATAEVKTDSKVKQVVSGDTGQTQSSPTSDSKDKAAEKAAKKAAALKKKKQSGQGTCVGLPQLLPGRSVTITGLESRLNGDYRIDSVSHSFGSDGFQTSFGIGGFD